MAVNETIVTGRKFRKLIDEVNKIWQRISFWTKACDVEFDDGENAESKINGIIDRFGGLSFVVMEDGTPGWKKDGADTVTPFKKVDSSSGGEGGGSSGGGVSGDTVSKSGDTGDADSAPYGSATGPLNGRGDTSLDANRTVYSPISPNTSGVLVIVTNVDVTSSSEVPVVSFVDGASGSRLYGPHKLYNMQHDKIHIQIYKYDSTSAEYGKCSVYTPKKGKVVIYNIH